MVNHQGLYRTTIAFDLESKSVHHANNRSHHVMVLWIGSLEMKVVRTSNPCLIKHRQLKILPKP